MGCPVHIWGPILAAMTPFARVARDRLYTFRDDRRARASANEPPREMKRWAPIQPHGAPHPSDTPDS